MRPIYETEQDLAREALVISTIDKRYNCTSAKLSISYQLDYLALRNNQPVAWIEIKCRTHSSTKHPTLILSLLKWECGIKRHRKETPFVLFASMTDGLYYYKWDGEFQPAIRWGGRGVLRDSGDQEPVIHIPMEKFLLL